ncbi:hypothetical protein NIES2101_05740 [Calothrix sp. HK-06]|nr:hypothetical protein NIES2101_05740 [Calothrix sp. HK-06]
MAVWFACFFLLFALAELFDWAKDFTLPLPIYILGGAFLAVASNYNKLMGSYFNETPNVIRDIIPTQAVEQSSQAVVFEAPQPVEHSLPASDE